MERILEPEVMDDADEAREYDAMDHRAPNAAFVERLVELGASGRMLDVGTGPGQVPPLVCERLPDATVVGIDLAASMLRHAERRRRASAHTDRIEYRLADAKRLPFEDGAFDAVFSNTILHHIADPRPFLAEVGRVLRPGGALLVRDLFRPEAAERADELVRLHAAGESPRQQALLRASLGAAFTPTELGDLARACGLADAQVVVDSDRHMSLQRPAVR